MYLLIVTVRIINIFTDKFTNLIESFGAGKSLGSLIQRSSEQIFAHKNKYGNERVVQKKQST